MSEIKDNILYPTDERELLDCSIFEKKPIVQLLIEHVRERLKTNGDAEWLINGSLRFNKKSKVYGKEAAKLSELEPAVKKIAGALQRVGVKSNDVVQCVLTNSAEFYNPLLGIWWANSIASTSDPSVTAEVLALQLEDTNAKVVFCCKATLGIVQEVVKTRPSVEKVVIVDSDKDIGDVVSLNNFTSGIDTDKVADPELRELDDVVIIYWSSGTTGRSKGIQHTQRFIQNSVMTPMDAGMDTTKSFFISTCMFHLGGSLTPLMIGLKNNMPVYFLAGEDGDHTPDLLNVISGCQPVFLAMGSHHCYQLSVAQNIEEYNLDSVAMMYGVGATLPPDLYDEMKKRLPNLLLILNPYGMTELGYAVCFGYNTKTIGGLQKGNVAKIVDPNTGEALGPEKEGEIVVKQNFYMKGYLNRPEEDAKFFGKDGFVHTGDLGHYDKHGNLYFDGRMKELIKYKNSHLYPLEIENIIYDQFKDDVLKVAVFGKPDPMVQELVTAAIVKKANSTLTEKDMIDFVNSKVEDFKKLRGGVMFLEEMPCSETGKIQRRKLVELVKK